MTSLLSPNAVNELRLTVTREQRPRDANSSRVAVSTAIGDFGMRSILLTIETDVKPVLNNSLFVDARAHDLKIGGGSGPCPDRSDVWLQLGWPLSAVQLGS